jgi:fumarate reductase flavoprotein subunit
MMGGVATDIDGATQVPGLFAAGETACVSINGANRLGSNSLPECLVFGARAGRAAAEFAASSMPPNGSTETQSEDERRRLNRLRSRTDGHVRIADIRQQIQQTMEDGAGIYRDHETLAKSADTLRDLAEHAATARIDDHSDTFNTELVAALELQNMLDLAQAIIASAMQRTESRGAHQRTDFPARDDKQFLAHSLAWREPDGTCRIDYQPVTITRWPPGERLYGR